MTTHPEDKLRSVKQLSHTLTALSIPNFGIRESLDVHLLHVHKLDSGATIIHKYMQIQTEYQKLIQFNFICNMS